MEWKYSALGVRSLAVGIASLPCGKEALATMKPETRAALATPSSVSWHGAVAGGSTREGSATPSSVSRASASWGTSSSGTSTCSTRCDQSVTGQRALEQVGHADVGCPGSQIAKVEMAFLHLQHPKDVGPLAI